MRKFLVIAFGVLVIASGWTANAQEACVADVSAYTGAGLKKRTPLFDAKSKMIKKQCHWASSGFGENIKGPQAPERPTPDQ